VKAHSKNTPNDTTSVDSVKSARESVAGPGNSALQEELLELRTGGDRDDVAQKAMSDPDLDIPYLAQMQEQFGDLSGITAHQSPDLAEAGAMGVASGEEVAFPSSSPSREVVSHEIAHVLGDGSSSEGSDEAGARRAESGRKAPMGPRPEKRGASEARFRLPVNDVEMGDLASQGSAAAEQPKPMTANKMADAIAWNGRKWKGSKRSSIRQALGAPAPAEGDFTEAEIHRVEAIQLGAGVPMKNVDGLIGDTTMAILLQSGLEFDLESTKKVNPKDVQLVFYPGEFEDLDKWKASIENAVKDNPSAPYRALSEPDGTGRIYVKHQGRLVAVLNARGGPPMRVRDMGGHTADPTQAGTHTLGKGHAHATNAWSMSQIPWGAPVRERDDKEWEYYDKASKSWRVATGSGSKLKTPLSREDFVNYNKGRDTWQVNDFGQEAFRIENSPGQLIHTTPDDEAATLRGETPELSTSHGCIHIDPSDREEMSRLGYLQGGVQLVVKKYSAHLLPDAMRNKMQGT